MSQGFDDKGRFGLWKNKDREKDTHPHLGGQGENLDGGKCWISAWFSKELTDDEKKQLQAIVNSHGERTNKPFINVTLKKKESQAAQAQAAINNSQAPADDSFDDDIPF